MKVSQMRGPTCETLTWNFKLKVCICGGFCQRSVEFFSISSRVTFSVSAVNDICITSHLDAGGGSTDVQSGHSNVYISVSGMSFTVFQRLPQLIEWRMKRCRSCCPGDLIKHVKQIHRIQIKRWQFTFPLSCYTAQTSEPESCSW